MEKAPEPGPKNKPTRPQGKPAAGNRKPQPNRKPTPQRPAPTRSAPAASAAKSPGAQAPAGKGETPTEAPVEDLVENPPTVAEEPPAAAAPESEPDAAEVALSTDAESPIEAETAPDVVSPDAAAPVAAAEHPPAARLAVPRLTLPKLTLPKFSTGRVKADAEVAETPAETPAPAEAATAEAEAVDAEAPEVVAEQEQAAEVVEVEVVEADAAEPEVAEAAEVPTDAEPEPEPEPEAAVVDVVPESAAVVVREPKARTAAIPVVKTKRRASDVVLSVENLTKRYDDKVAVNAVNLEVKVGSFYGIVGPNGAGKTTTLSMITGLLRPDAGTVTIHGADVWSDPVVAKRNMGVLPDRLRLFDRLTGAQVLYYAGVLRGLDEATVRTRTADLAAAFGLEEALARLVTDYSAGMTKKVALAAAMIHSPRILVLDEPFESVDPVSAATVTSILRSYVDAGGTVVLSSHSMDLVQRICDSVAVIVGGDLLADGTMAQVRGGGTLEERFVELAGGRKTVEELEWLHDFSD